MTSLEARVGPTRAPRSGAIVICGLGRLGKECAALLKAFGAQVVGVDFQPPPPDDEILALLDRLVVGDCARSDILRQAGVADCRTLLILTDDARSNIAAALAARLLNARARIVIRSAQENLNELLAQHLGDLVAFEPDRFSATAFAVAALANETKAWFDLAETRARVVAHRVESGDWCDGKRPGELNSLNRRIVSHVSGGRALVDLFDRTNGAEIVSPGDEITFIACGDLSRDARKTEGLEKRRKKLLWGRRIGRARGWLRGAPLAALASLAIVAALTVGGVLLYRAENPDISWFDAINVSVVLAVGGFDNVFGALKAPFPISPGLYAFSLLTKLTSSIFLGIVFATITEKILGARFAIAARRPEPPAEQHTIIVGLGPIGQNIAAQLKRWGRAAVGVSDQPVAENILRDLPIETGPARDALERANIGAARSVVIAGDDAIANLECMLLARSMNPHCELVFRVADRELAANVAALVPESQGIDEWEVAAEAIVGAAFGESILSAFRLRGRSILVTQYAVEPGDTLIGRQLAHMAYGYGAVPLLHRRDETTKLNPSDDSRLEAGDQLVVLATVAALGRIERGELQPPDGRLIVESCRAAANAFEAGNCIARIAGCDLATARQALTALPRALDRPLYRPQGARLVRELSRIGVTARLTDL